MTRRDFARALTAVRQRARLTIRDVAGRTEIPVATVGGYFSGRNLPKADQEINLTMILKECGITDRGEVTQWQEALIRVRRTPGKRPAGDADPYRGLECYEPEDTDWFFGRKTLTARLVAQLAERHDSGGVIVVGGPSGSGKSSLLRAGLIARLGAGDVAVPGSKEWPWLLLPTPGLRPLQELASRLAAMTKTVEPELAHQELRADPACCAALARQVCRARGSGESARLVVIVDQFEEVFAPDVDQAERAAFIAALDAAGNRTDASDTNGTTRSPAALVVLGLRADFYRQAMESGPALVTALQDGQVVVGPMNEQELREAITQPARLARGELEEGLVELLLRDLQPDRTHDPRGGGEHKDARAHERGALPFVSHALLATWTASLDNNRRMTVAAYEASGGIRAAVKQTAETLYKQLTERQKDLARQLFLRLVRVSEDAADTLRRVRYAELVDGDDGARSDDVTDVLEQFVACRLITVDQDYVEITHNALLTAWPRLGDWINDDRVDAVTRRQLSEAAVGWRASHDPAYLYRGVRLAAAQARAADPRYQAGLNALEREFLRASIDQHEAEEQAERNRILQLRQYIRRLRQYLAVVVVLAALASVLAGYVFVQQRIALEQRRIAVEQRILAVSRQVAAEAGSGEETARIER